MKNTNIYIIRAFFNLLERKPRFNIFSAFESFELATEYTKFTELPLGFSVCPFVSRIIKKILCDKLFHFLITS